jgi:hypothetical protein
MSRSMLWLFVALAASPAIAYLTYWLAKELGFLEAPIDAQHAYRRSIILLLYSFLLFLPVLLYGFDKGWPRAWVWFGVLNALALVGFGAAGILSAVRLWRLRHPEPAEPLIASAAASTGSEDLPAHSERDTEELL